jgi:hypothetical protein
MHQPPGGVGGGPSRRQAVGGVTVSTADLAFLGGRSDSSLVPLPKQFRKPRLAELDPPLLSDLPRAAFGAGAPFHSPRRRLAHAIDPPTCRASQEDLVERPANGMDGATTGPEDGVEEQKNSHALAEPPRLPSILVRLTVQLPMW